MRVFTDLNALPQFRNSVVTIGSFDGIHLGHQKIISKITQLAQEEDGESIVITFHPHPRIVLSKGTADLKLLHSIEEKIYWLNQYKVDNLIIVPFNESFSNQSPADYIHNFLLKNFNPKHIVIGYDHKFGKNRAGNIDLMKAELGIDGPEVFEIQKEEINNLAISSSKVRKAITEGEMMKAKELLGHSYTLRGEVVTGEKLGKTLGFPTANIKLDEKYKLIPQQGIYAVTVAIEGNEKTALKGMLYIGDRPSLNHLTNLSIEVNIFDFDEDIYGKKIMLQIEKFIRGDKKYDSLDALKAAIAEDKISVESFFNAEQKNPAIKKTNKIDPEVAVVILNYNGKEHLEKYLPSVLQTDYSNLRIIIADNASTDDSIDLLKRKFPNTELQLLDKNYGFTGGYAHSLSVIDSEYIVLMNSDVRVEKNWLQEAMKVITSDETIAVVQPKILSDKKPTHFEYAGAAGGYIDRWGFPFCRGRLFDTLEEDKHQYEEESDIFWASGCAFLIKNDLYKKVGGLDPQFFAHLEEIDLCWRIQRMGYSIRYAPKSIVYHLGGGTLSYQNPKKTFLNFRNSLIMITKNKHGLSLFINIIVRLKLDGIAGIKFLVSGRPMDCWAIIKAHFSYYSKFFQIRKRKIYESKAISVGRNTEKIKIKGIYKKSIVADYFLRGIQHFSDIDKNNIS